MVARLTPRLPWQQLGLLHSCARSDAPLRSCGTCSQASCCFAILCGWWRPYLQGASFLSQVTTFGMGLVTLDVRQESTKHAQAVDAITSYLGLGSYLEWDEEKRQQFLMAELTGKRPLLPPGARFS